MLPDEVIPKVELMRIMKRFIEDKDRGISLALFAELAGLNHFTIRDVFLYERDPLSEYVQRRVSKAYKAFVSGQVAVMQNRDTSKFVEYRKVARPRFKKVQRLKVVNGKIQLDIGIRPKHDYSTPNLDEQL